MFRRRSRRVLWLRFLKRMGVFNRMLFPSEGLSNEQKMGFRIFNRSVNIKDCEIFVSPNTDSIYISVEEIYIILRGNHLQIINGRFQYDFTYPEDNIIKMKRRVSEILEVRRIEIENKIKNKSERTLNAILEDITKLGNK